jgi:hypothetical protein
MLQNSFNPRTSRVRRLASSLQTSFNNNIIFRTIYRKIYCQIKLRRSRPFRGVTLRDARQPCYRGRRGCACAFNRPSVQVQFTGSRIWTARQSVLVVQIFIRSRPAPEWQQPDHCGAICRWPVGFRISSSCPAWSIDALPPPRRGFPFSAASPTPRDSTTRPPTHRRPLSGHDGTVGADQQLGARSCPAAVRPLPDGPGRVLVVRCGPVCGPAPTNHLLTASHGASRRSLA